MSGFASAFASGLASGLASGFGVVALHGEQPRRGAVAAGRQGVDGAELRVGAGVGGHELGDGSIAGARLELGYGGA